MDDELEQVLDETYLDGCAALDVAGLRAMRAECRRLETMLSYLRRIAQARSDIVTAELTRRGDGGDPAAVSDLVERLPGVLADRPGTASVGPVPQYLAPGAVEGALADELAEMEIASHLDELSGIPAERLETIRTDLDAYERRISSLRQRLFGRIDTLGAELGRRYAAGEADIDTAIVER